jgi:hypothetical protein
MTPIEHMPARVVAHLVGKVGMAQRGCEFHDRAGRAGGRMQRDGFGVGHAGSPFVSRTL